MHIHVFAIDILPSEKAVSTGGGLRSLQIISGLKKIGFDVTYSIPSMTQLAKANWENLTNDERKNAFSWRAGTTYEDILARLKPDVVFCLWPSLYTFTRHRTEGPIIVYDINGFQNVEGVLAEVASGGFGSLRAKTEHYLNKIQTADIILCGSSEQKAYWSGLLSFHTDAYTVPDMIRLPYSPPHLPAIEHYNLGGPTFFCTGAFLPWNSPEGHLSTCASLLKDAGRGEMFVIGKPDNSMVHARQIEHDFKSLNEHDFVHMIPGLPYPELSKLINNKGIAIDLNTKTLEREFAIPIRTITYLAHGVPLITNDYSAIGKEIAACDAGWCINPSDASKFREVVQDVLASTSQSLETKSRNARRLISERFSTDESFAILKEGIFSAESARNVEKRAQQRRAPVKADLRPCVLVISDDFENFLELRVRIPFDAMYKSGLIKGYHLLHKGKIVRSVGVKADIAEIDVVWVQRCPVASPLFITDMLDGRFVYDIDDNLLISPSYRPAFSNEWCRHIRSLLSGAGAIATTSVRLASSLQRHSGIQIEQKAFIAPNLAERIDPLPGRSPPDALLLASSDFLPLTTSLEPFISAIRRFTESHRLPLIYVGSTVNNLKNYGINAHATGFLSYQTYREYLRQGNFLGVVPLESSGDERTLEFVNCKSDIKMVEFGSIGLPGVYSDVAPYQETPLTCGPLINMFDEHALFEALERTYFEPDHWRLTASQSVAEHRLAVDTVERTWFQAIQSARMPTPLNLETLQENFIKYSKFLRETPAPKELFIESDYINTNQDTITHIGEGEGAVYRDYASNGVEAGKLWFPASVSNAHELMAAVREGVIIENESLNSLQSRVDLAITRLSTISSNSSADLNAQPIAKSQDNIDITQVSSNNNLRRYISELVSTKFLRKGGIKALFDSDFYLNRNLDVRDAKFDPYIHYLKFGASEARAPNAFFDPLWYSEKYLGSKPVGVDTLEHYIEVGARQGLDPSPRFSTVDYMEMYPDVNRCGLNPLEHFLKVGRAERRLTKKPVKA
jgi:glycosyltransferase involved in cell wall biosynthesis